MYSYYGLAAIGSQRVNEYLTWKKYITRLQLIQFFYAMTNALLYFTSDCDFPAFHYYFFVPYMVTMIVLFSQYYYGAYRVRKVKDC